MMILPYFIGGVYKIFEEKPKSAQDVKAAVYTRTAISSAMQKVSAGQKKGKSSRKRTQMSRIV